MSCILKRLPDFISINFVLLIAISSIQGLFLVATCLCYLYHFANIIIRGLPKLGLTPHCQWLRVMVLEWRSEKGLVVRVLIRGVLQIFHKMNTCCFLLAIIVEIPLFPNIGLNSLVVTSIAHLVKHTIIPHHTVQQLNDGSS